MTRVPLKGQKPVRNQSETRQKPAKRNHLFPSLPPSLSLSFSLSLPLPFFPCPATRTPTPIPTPIPTPTPTTTTTPAATTTTPTPTPTAYYCEFFFRTAQFSFLLKYENECVHGQKPVRNLSETGQARVSSSGSGVAVVAALVVILRVVATLTSRRIRP